MIRTIRTHHAHFGHYHTAGNPGRNDMDETQELYYPAIMRAILTSSWSIIPRSLVGALPGLPHMKDARSKRPSVLHDLRVCHAMTPP